VFVELTHVEEGLPNQTLLREIWKKMMNFFILGGPILFMPKLLQIAWSLSSALLFQWIKTESSKDRKEFQLIIIAYFRDFGMN
jgi:hypothetical protein